MHHRILTPLRLHNHRKPVEIHLRRNSNIHPSITSMTIPIVTMRNLRTLPYRRLIRLTRYIQPINSLINYVTQTRRVIGRTARSLKELHQTVIQFNRRQIRCVDGPTIPYKAIIYPIHVRLLRRLHSMRTQPMQRMPQLLTQPQAIQTRISTS